MTDGERTYPERPLVGVGAAVFRAGRVLLIRRATPPRRGEWSLPGGLQQLGETVFAAAAREVAEETGVTARILATVDVVDMIERDPADGRVRRHYTLVDVVGTWLAGEPAAASDAADAAWVSLEELPGLGLWSETERIIDLAHARWRQAGAP